MSVQNRDGLLAAIDQWRKSADAPDKLALLLGSRLEKIGRLAHRSTLTRGHSQCSIERIVEH